ncbi:MAG: DUF3073 domain-containing protein [Candidatus Nanopelagicales bacterium]|jgi:hypothetical protein|nr:DUF3073 domain-containing protein [Candidatus Nanopelagicales bacterium]MCH1448017.1 DUF3073 domain-containing protein [Candidatus Nanopelagicales bacterium]MCP4744231.1 DUF3073 domain-containing protein [Actinomycetales bacterium]NKB92240.1 DUF3073 family protein [Candidatus Nanopelagicales bacterium]
MGRGRAKAKQTKVARALKYGGPQTDLQQLEAELTGGSDSADVDADDSGVDEGDPYADDPYAPDSDGYEDEQN